MFDSPLATELVPLVAFYVAEDYHHDYAARNPDQPYVRAVAPDGEPLPDKLGRGAPEGEPSQPR